jgi:hypothetical protein
VLAGNVVLCVLGALCGFPNQWDSTAEVAEDAEDIQTCHRPEFRPTTARVRENFLGIQKLPICYEADDRLD